MERKLVITVQDANIISSILENGKIVEIHCYPKDQNHKKAVLGNIYIGKVKRVVSNINAAFVDIGGCECYYSQADNQSAVFLSRGSVKKPLVAGDELLVQVQKEAVKNKVPTVTGKLSFQGKYAVLTTGNTKIGVSTKIGAKRRQELLHVMEPYHAPDYGFVIRTNAGDIEDEKLIYEIEKLTENYRKLMETANQRTCYSCLYQYPSTYLGDIRNIYQDGLTEILTEDSVLYQEISEFLLCYQPEDLNKLRLYQDTQLPLHKLYSIETALAKALKSKVWLKSGGYLVIEPTEALTVIDVNTGRAIDKKNSSAFVKTNLEAAQEIASQIRLRNLSGIIIIDFINLDEKAEMKHLLETFRKYLNADPITTVLVGVTGLQLVEVTRKKVKKPLHESLL